MVEILWDRVITVFLKYYFLLMIFFSLRQAIVKVLSTHMPLL